MAEENINKWMDHAWLGLGDTSKLMYKNPFLETRSAYDIEHPDIYYGRFMRDPEYLSFACSQLLNVLTISGCHIAGIMDKTLPYVCRKSWLF